MTKHDPTHNILGRYCWTCNLKTEAGVPGWTPNAVGTVRYSPWAIKDGRGVTEGIVWANSDVVRPRDQSICSVCGLNCANPVERGVTGTTDGYNVLDRRRNVN